VDLDLGATPNDPEFGSQRLGLLAGSLDDEPEAYLRLVANPFLAFAYVVFWLLLLYESLFGSLAQGSTWPLIPTLVAILIAGLGLIPLLLQFQCLDCGRSGRLSRWRKHICQQSLARRNAGRRRRLRGPTPPIQVLIWMWVVAAGVVGLNALRMSILG
jgi:hypothetical protein